MAKILLKGSTRELSQLLNITQRRINQLVEEKILTREANGEFVLPKAISDYYVFKYKNTEQVDFNKEKALHERAKRRLAEFEVRKRANELHEATDVEAVLTEMLINLRNNLLSIPPKMATQLAGKSKYEIEEILRKEIEFHLLELKDYSPTMFNNKVDGDDSG